MIRWAVVLSLSVLALACGESERIRFGKPTKVDLTPTSATEETVDAAMSGEALYGVHCARCHGVEGDGKGSEKLETPARDFAAGGFSFGNTRTALFKTISRGIAGKEMPAFADVMNENERWRVIDHLLTLMPEQKKVDAKARVLEPTTRPLIARGALYRKKGERAHITRGLMIGYPIGMSFEYRVDSPRLLRVREGGFVDRADWDGRGGALLEPLGKVLHEVSGGKAASTFRDAKGEALQAKYRGVTIRDAKSLPADSRRNRQGIVTLSYALPDGAAVTEWHECRASNMGSYYRRHFNIEGSTTPKVLVIEEAPGGTWVSGEELSKEAGGEPGAERDFWLLRRSNGTSVAFRSRTAGRLRLDGDTLVCELAATSKLKVMLDVIPGRKRNGAGVRTLAAELKNN